MDSLSEFVWSRGIDWSSRRKLPFFEREGDALAPLGHARHALLLWDLEQDGAARAALQRAAHAASGTLPLPWLVCDSLQAVMSGNARAAQRVEGLLYRLSVEALDATGEASTGIFEPFLTQFVFQHEAGLLTDRRRRMAEAVLTLLEEVLSAFCSHKGSALIGLRLLHVCAREDLALQRAREEMLQDPGRDAALATVIYDQWVSGSADEAERILEELCEQPSGIELVDYWRAIAAAVCGRHDLALRNFAAVMKGNPNFLAQGTASRNFTTVVLLKALGWTDFCTAHWRRITGASDFVAMRKCVLDRVPVASPAHPVPDALADWIA